MITSFINLLSKKTCEIAINITSWNMREYFNILDFLRKIHHSQWSSDIALDGLIQSSIKIDTGCTVDDYMTPFHYLFVVIFGKT